MLFRAFGIAVLVNLGIAAVAHGQISALAQLYGEGVHRYFSGDYAGTELSLNRAVEAGSQDPRVFYFRGLTRAAYGGGGEMDYEEGARLEASGRVGVNIGFALTRIQGHERAKIEKARQDVRLFAQQQRELMRQAEPAVPAPQAPSTTEPPAATDPFSGDGLRSEEVEVVPSPSETPAEPEDTAVDPFVDEPPSSEPSSESPAGEGATDSDPFGTSDPPAEVEPTESDPFG